MKVLVTQHIHDCAADKVHTKQFVIESARTSIREVFAEHNQLAEGPNWTPDRWTTINDYGLFVTCPVCAESWVIIDHSTPEYVPESVDSPAFSGADCLAWRKRLRMSRETLARLSGVSLMSITRFENNAEHGIRCTTLFKIRNALRGAM